MPPEEEETRLPRVSEEDLAILKDWAENHRVFIPIHEKRSPSTVERSVPMNRRATYLLLLSGAIVSLAIYSGRAAGPRAAPQGAQEKQAKDAPDDEAERHRLARSGLRRHHEVGVGGLEHMRLHGRRVVVVTLAQRLPYCVRASA